MPITLNGYDNAEALAEDILRYLTGSGLPIEIRGEGIPETGTICVEGSDDQKQPWMLYVLVKDGKAVGVQ